MGSKCTVCLSEGQELDPEAESTRRQIFQVGIREELSSTSISNGMVCLMW